MNNFNSFSNYNFTRNVSPFSTVGSSALNASSLTRGSFLSRLGGFNLSSLLNGAQKTIGTVNQIIPLYNQVKPMFTNSKILLNVAKSLKGNETNKGLFSIRRRNNNYTVQQSNKTEEVIEVKEEIKKDGTKPSKPFFI